MAAKRSTPRRTGVGRGRSRGAQAKPLEVLAGGVFLALVAGAVTWWALGTAGMEPDSWSAGLLIGIAIGMVAAMALGAVARPVLKAAAKKL